MGLNATLQIARSAVTVSQAGIQIAGNNMANAATPGYSRQTALLVPGRDDRIGADSFVGTGVLLQDVQRQVDEAIRARLRDALSEEHAALAEQSILTQIETLQNELSDADLSSAISEFFNAWSELANNPEDVAVRTLVIEQGDVLAAKLRDLRTDTARLRDQVDDDVAARVDRANALLDEIAGLNLSIAQAERGQSTAGSLRDQRDRALEELAGFMDITVVEQASGSIDVLVGSTPVVLGGESRGVELRRESDGDQLMISVRVSADGSELPIRGGSLGALIEARSDIVQASIDDLDQLASSLIFEVNRVHGQGQGVRGYSSLTSQYAVEDTTVALNSDAAGLPFDIRNGSFQIHVTHQATGERTTFRVDVDLEGVGSDMSLDDLVSAINGSASSAGLTAAVDGGGRLTLSVDAGYEFSFSDDTSGVLAGLGLNVYFTGENASDIGVADELMNDASLLATRRGHVPGSNGGALAMVELESAAVEGLGGTSIPQYWRRRVEQVGVQLHTVNSRVATGALVRESLQAQDAARSGVSIDEETINLMNYQRQFEAAARLINVIDQLTRELMSVI